MNAQIRSGVVALVGDPTPGSRTATAAKEVAIRLCRHLRAGTPRVIELAEATPPFGADAADRLHTELLQLTTAAAVVVASPVRNGSYTGLLKAFLDLVVEPLALRGAVAVPLMTSSGEASPLPADVYLRPVLQDLGASLPTPSVVLGDAEFTRLDSEVDAWWAEAAPTFAGLGSLMTLSA